MHIKKDILILGGGIAGLWLLTRLRAAGYEAVLVEHETLGAGQTIASQGMIHGGLKYALGGSLTRASERIADMPAQWRACLAGKGEVDLRGTRVLSDTYYLWPRNNMRSRFNAFLGSKLVQGKADAVAEADWPELFRGHIKGPLYRLQDLVLDVESLLHTLAAINKPWIHRLPNPEQHLQFDATGRITALVLDDGIRIEVQCVIGTAGLGNAALLQAMHGATFSMQRRPLHMVVLKHALPSPVYVHCVSDQLTATPEVTITTHTCRDGSTAWYLGGELAEAGVNKSRDEQIACARDKLRDLFPWCDFSAARFHSFHIERAELGQVDGKRPDGPGVGIAQNLLLCWPTKLTLTPSLATHVLRILQERNITPGASDSRPLPLPQPDVAMLIWDQF